MQQVELILGEVEAEVVLAFAAEGESAVVLAEESLAADAPAAKVGQKRSTGEGAGAELVHMPARRI